VFAHASGLTDSVEKAAAASMKTIIIVTRQRG